MGVAGELEKAQGLLASGDISGLLRYLRADGEALPLGEVARLVAGAARLAGFDDLAQAAAAAAEGGDGPGAEDARALYDFGYACTGRGVCYLAVRPLARALELAPDAAPVLSELVTALEQDGQHARAVAVLEEHEPVMHMQWLPRFQYVYNALMAGDLEKAAEGFGRLPEPEDTAWAPAREKVRRILARASTARAVTSLDRQDLRGWHYVLTGGVLATLSPYGFAGMTGRWAYLSDSAGGCAAVLQRLRLILAAAGTAPDAVALLPDRSSRILGAAAAAVLGLPADGFRPRQARRELPCRRLRSDRDRPGRGHGPARARPWPGPVRAGNVLDRPAPASPPTSVACSPRRSSRRGPRSRAASTTAPSARARQTTARPRLSPPGSPAPCPSRMRATAALLRTPAKACAASSRRSRPQAPATAAGSAASASTSPTSARCPAAGSSEPATDPASCGVCDTPGSGEAWGECLG